MSIINKFPTAETLPVFPCPFYLSIVRGREIIINNAANCGISLNITNNNGTAKTSQSYTRYFKGVFTMSTWSYYINEFFYKTSSYDIFKSNSFTFKLVASQDIKPYSTSGYVTLGGIYDLPRELIPYGTEYYVEITPPQSKYSTSYTSRCISKDGTVLATGTATGTINSSLLYMPIYRIGERVDTRQ